MDEIFLLMAECETDFPAALLEARSRLLDYLESGENNGNVLVLLAEVHYWLGIHTKDHDTREEYLAQGVEYGQLAAAATPDSAAANFWYANCMLAHGMVRGILNSLVYLEPMEKYGNRAIELDETCFNAGPLRIMGRFYSKVPPRPVGVGDKRKGLKLAQRAVELEPGYLFNKVALADAYLSARYFEESRQLLREILATPKSGEFRLSHIMCMAEARQILERLENME